MKWIRRLLQKPHDTPRYIWTTDNDYDLYAMGKKAVAIRVPKDTLPPLPDWWDDNDTRIFRLNVGILKVRKSRLLDT